MSDLEATLAELEVQHKDLAQSYESLQLEYATVKQELETLQGSYSKQESLCDGSGADLCQKRHVSNCPGTFDGNL
jgi:chromosome segregation ATPase